MKQSMKRPQRFAPRRIMILAFELIFRCRLEERPRLLEVVKPVVMKLVDDRRGELIGIAWHAAYKRARQFRAADTSEVSFPSRLERDRANRLAKMGKRRALESRDRR